jgi:hypothetical protein
LNKRENRLKKSMERTWGICETVTKIPVHMTSPH